MYFQFQWQSRVKKRSEKNRPMAVMVLYFPFKFSVSWSWEHSWTLRMCTDLMETSAKSREKEYLFTIVLIVMERVWKLIKTSVRQTISLSNDNLNWIRPFLETIYNREIDELKQNKSGPNKWINCAHLHKITFWELLHWLSSPHRKSNSIILL